MLVIPRDLYERMLAQCREEFPREACGIMTGMGGSVKRAFALCNAHSQPTIRFQIDLLDQQVAMRDVLAGREELVAIYHSHPTTVAYPSQTDIDMAFYPDSIYLIASMVKEPPDVQAYRIVDGKVTREPLRCADGMPGEWVDLR